MRSKVFNLYSHLIKVAAFKLSREKIKPKLNFNIEIKQYKDCILYIINSPIGNEHFTPIEFINSYYYNYLDAHAQKHFIEQSLRVYDSIPKRQFHAECVKPNIFRIVCLQTEEIIAIDNASDLLKDFDIIRNLDHESYQTLLVSTKKSRLTLIS
ncbi:hypothetical protein GCM10010995_05680 [Cysteiniphilum litorale]|uniref:Uncharacterized protein n=1 Tax=Cysteiniphilum litorale TaxID=2056700 RepID=A0A8J2Z2T0_9GAMM|nr:hypothetical protein GCM10010995_05680 [Cysteiniphilum litorale]